MDLDELVAQCIDRFEAEGPEVVEELCRLHPPHAEVLRRRVDHLVQIGLLGERSDQRLPDRLGEFRLIGVLGGGGMGLVMRAVQEPLQREVALKLIRPDHLYFPESRDRFRREVETIARLQHPGIVPVYSVGEEKGLPFFAMELVQGCSLDEVIQACATKDPSRLQGGDFARAVATYTSGAEGDELAETNFQFAGTWAETCVRIVRSVADALEHAHRRSVVHRDVKPSNVMVTASGRVLLLDFGLSADDRSERLTRSGARLGSLAYMSPEQARGETASLDGRTDVYSLGVALYELLTLRAPFSAPSSHELLARIESGDCSALRSLNPAVSWDLETVCAKAMENDRGRRYPTAADFARDLGNVLDRRPIEARRAGSLRRVARWSQRRPAVAVSVLFGGLVALGGPITFGLQEYRNRVRLEERNEVASAGFSAALDAVDRMLARLAEVELQYIPQMEPVRLQLLEDAVKLYRRLAPFEAEDLGLATRLARVRGSEATFLRELGRVSESEEVGTDALRRVELLRSRDPDAVALNDLWYELSTSQAVTLHSLGRTDDADRLLAEAAEFDARWHARAASAFPASTPASEELTLRQLSTIVLRANLAGEVGDMQRSRELYDEASARLEPLLIEAPSAEVLRSAVELYSERGFRLNPAALNIGAGDEPEFEVALSRAVELGERLVAEPEANPRDVFLLQVARNNLGSLLRRLRRYDESSQHLELAREALTDLCARFPSTVAYRKQLATVINNLGVTYDVTGSELAEETFLASVAELSNLVERYPDVAEFRAILGSGERNVAHLLDAAGQYARAKEHITRAILHARRAVELAPDIPRWQEFLSDDLSILARIEFRLEEFEAVLDTLRQIAEIDLENGRWTVDALLATQSVLRGARDLASRGRDEIRHAAEKFFDLALYLADEALAMGTLSQQTLREDVRFSLYSTSEEWNELVEEEQGGKR